MMLAQCTPQSSKVLRSKQEVKSKVKLEGLKLQKRDCMMLAQCKASLCSPVKVLWEKLVK